MDKKERSINKTEGYTFVELLVAISIFSILGTVVVTILFITLSGSKKSDLQVTLRRNGSNIQSQVSKEIRYAKSLDEPASCVTPVPSASSITITSGTNGEKIIYTCTGGGSIESNGESLIDTNTTIVTSCSFSCSQATEVDPPTIVFTFSLTSKNAVGPLESSGTLPFKSTVTIVNYAK